MLGDRDIVARWREEIWNRATPRPVTLGVELPAAADRALAMLARRPLSVAFAQQAMSKGKKPTRFANIDALVKGGGDVTIGRIGPARCAATASDGDQSLAMLVRRPRESFEDLLDRLDGAIGKAWDDEEYIDEING